MAHLRLLWLEVTPELLGGGAHHNVVVVAPLIMKFDTGIKLDVCKPLSNGVNLNKLDNANNLENGKSNNILLIYHVNACDDSTHFENS